jgi:predicted dinucleotide-binding enzyme/putative intracellular protease/amidase
MQIAVLGTGRVGSQLARGLAAAGHRVVLGSRNPDARAPGTEPVVPVRSYADAVADAEVVLLAVPFAAAAELLVGLGDLGGRILIDATNPIGVDTAGRTGADLVAAAATNARVVKAFNTIGAEHMADARFAGGAAFALLAGDDEAARDVVGGLAEALGFEPVHLGDLATARHAEAAARLWIHLVFARGYGRDIGVGLLRRPIPPLSTARSTKESQVSKKILIVASNPTVSAQTGWPVGFWLSELTHPYAEFVQAGYEVTIVSPDGGPIRPDDYSDPRHESGYSADDILSLGFLSSPRHAGLLVDTVALSQVDPSGYDAVFLVGGQAPMFTFHNDERVHRLIADAHQQGKVVAVVCHATAALLKARTPDGELLVKDKTWTGFANSEEDAADAAVGRKLQPFRIEDEARAITGTNFIVQRAFRPHAVRDGNLITGQQQNSGAAAARLVIEALGH